MRILGFGMNHNEYIIDGIIQFIPGQDMVCLKETPEVVLPLSPACTQLLLIFINNKGVVLSREHILDLFWEQMGSTPSGNSLNAYVSSIRRAFAGMGLTQEIITTVYKVGFVFNPDISIEFVGKDNFEEKKSNGESDKELNNDIIDNNAIEKKTKADRCIILLLLCSLVTILGIPIIIQQKEIVPEKITSGLNECSINYLPFHSGERYYASDKMKNDILTRSGFDCTKGGEYYFYADKRVQDGSSGNIYVAYCIKKGTELERCKDYMEHLWSYNNE